MLEVERRTEVAARYFPDNQYRLYVIEELRSRCERHSEALKGFTDCTKWIRYAKKEFNYKQPWALAIWDLVKGI